MSLSGFSLAFLSGCLLALLLPAASAQALDITDGFRLKGFGSLVVTHGGDEEFGYITDFSSAAQHGGWELSTDSVIGMQLDADVHSQWRAVVQVVAKDREHNHLGDLLERAYLQYQPTADLDINAGRLAMDIYGLSEYRDVGFAYPWIRPVTEFYTPMVARSLDGLAVQYTRRLGSGVIRSKLFAGTASGDVVTELIDFEFRLSPVIGLKLEYESGNWRSRLTAVTSEIGDIENPFESLNALLNSIPASQWPGLDEILAATDGEGRRMSYYSLGLAYDSFHWQMKSELSLTQAAYDLTPTNEAAYISLGRRIVDDVNVHIMYSRARTTGDYLSVPLPQAASLLGLQQVLEQSINTARWDQHTWSLGMRWNIRPKLALKLQLDRSDIAAGGSGLWETGLDNNAQAKSLNTLAVGLDFLF